MTRPVGAKGAGRRRLRLGRDEGSEVLLRVLATTDVHANLLSYDYASNRPLHGQGLAQMASLIAAARAEVPSALLVDNGDFLQGTALAELAARGRRRRGHPVIAAMNMLGYDAAALGNHEFNYGLEVLGRAMAEAQFPVLSANVVLQVGAGGPLEDVTLAPPFALVDRVLTDGHGQEQRLKVGILGLTPPEITRWDHSHLQGRLETRPMQEAACVWVPEMRRAGADLVICLAHTGIADCPDGQRGEALAADLAELPGIDALVLGHSHLVFPGRGQHPDARVDLQLGRIAGKPAVQPGHSGSHLGLMDLRLRHRAGKGWSIAAAEVQAQSVSEVTAGLPTAAILRHTKGLRRAVGGDHRATLAWTRRVLGQTDLAMSTAFAQVADVAAMRLVARAKLDHARRALAGGAYDGLPILASATPYRAGGRGGPLNYSDIERGPLSMRHVFDLYPFPNTLVAHLINGAELAEQLEQAAAIYHQILPGQTGRLLIDPAFPAYGFATVLGVSYQVDLTRPARYDARSGLIRPDARRIVNLRRGGKPVQQADRFVLVTNSFRASGPLGIAPPLPDQVVLERPVLCTDILRDHIRQTGRIAADALAMGEGWSLRPVPGAEVLFDTGPGAINHLQDVAALQPEFEGLTDDGFHRFRLHL
jgi:2',3'-cyclic-nucleotide 2'-phosphodiesterase/3'-nucleotidase